MNLIRPFIFVAAIVVAFTGRCLAQGYPAFSSEAYSQFLNAHRDITPDQLGALYNAGRFTARLGVNFSAASYFDSINTFYKFTNDEKTLLHDHGFVVTDRLRRGSFGEAFLEIYKRDLPVFVSTDALLHALHMSWDAILKEVEEQILINKLDTLLARLQGQLPALASRYGSVPAMKPMINDVDVYLTVPRVLLGSTMGPAFSENAATVGELLTAVKAERATSFKLFSENERAIDFSQFTVRGHYTQSARLKQYFQAMIWLGRIEIYLIAPKSDNGSQQSNSDIRRQSIDAVLLQEAAENSGVFLLLEEIDGIIRSFTGESDNVTLPNIRSLVRGMQLVSADALLDTSRLADFRATLLQKANTFQRINSQILMSDPMSPDQVQPASAFLLLGQRFVIDSYTTGNVVYDRIVYANTKVRRMLPSPLDVLFALGNDAAGQLLVPELDRYKYSANLAATRYLVDSYEPGFWTGTIYNGWLNSIRALNPPADRGSLPAFMQTAAWWQEKMNTQLASWAQLRHDFILYAKQSYSAGVVCSFPASYVEPIPQFYDAVKSFADGAASLFQQPVLQNIRVSYYFRFMSSVADTLGAIARKELARAPFTEAENLFLKTMLYDTPSGCTVAFRGWYSRLFYTGETGLMKNDLIVADVHTAPTDEAGNLVGWVLHAGTGPLNLAVVATEQWDGTMGVFIGPVMSYYQHVSTNFKRLTDDEWMKAFALAPSFRPSFIGLYLADSTGEKPTQAQSLLTGVDNDNGPVVVPVAITLAQNYPNPFNSSTVIMFSVRGEISTTPVSLSVYDMQGRLVRRLLHSALSEGTYVTRWDGTDDQGNTMASGVYFYHLFAGTQRASGKMSFVK